MVFYDHDNAYDGIKSYNDTNIKKFPSLQDLASDKNK